MPGQSSAAQVEALMGPAADKRASAGGETAYYYPRLPWGYATYVARIGADGRLVALEQRLTVENTEKLVVGAPVNLTHDASGMALRVQVGPKR